MPLAPFISARCSAGIFGLNGSLISELAWCHCILWSVEYSKLHLHGQQYPYFSVALRLINYGYLEVYRTTATGGSAMCTAQAAKLASQLGFRRRHEKADLLGESHAAFELHFPAHVGGHTTKLAARKREQVRVADGDRAVGLVGRADAHARRRALGLDGPVRARARRPPRHAEAEDAVHLQHRVVRVNHQRYFGS
eukprot:82232-Pleurochrysis_carterae.AAC.1